MFKLNSSLCDEAGDGKGGSGGSGNDAQLGDLKAEVDRLKNHNAKLLDEKKTIQSQLKKFDGIDVEQVNKMMKAFENNEDLKLASEGKINDVINKHTERLRLDYQQKENAWNEQKQTYEKDNASLKSKYVELKIGTAIRKEAEKAGVLPAAIDDVIARSDGMFSLDDNENIESRDKDGNLRTVKGKALDPALFIEQLKESAPHFWPGSQGVGAGGGSDSGYKGKNPFKPGPDFNLTEQARLMNTDPKRAERLKLAASS